MEVNVRKIIKGLECCSSNRGMQTCYGCPYGDEENGCDQVLLDALVVLKNIENERAGN